jgi:hypothetical protein
MESRCARIDYDGTLETGALLRLHNPNPAYNYGLYKGTEPPSL